MGKDKNGRELPRGVRQRSDGLYEGRTKIFGENYSVYADTPKEAQDKLEELRYQVRHGLYCKPNEETMDSWFEIWLKTYKENTVKKSTLQIYSLAYNELISPRMGRRKVCDVTSQAIQRFINDLYKRGLSKSRVKLVYALLSGMLAQAQKNGIINKNPLEAVTFPKYPAQRPEDKRVMSVVEQQRFLEAAEGSKYYDFYIVALTTGMRINEVLALQWSDIDFKKKEIRVKGTLFYQRGISRRDSGRSIEPPKTESSRRNIPMLEITENVLRARRKNQLEWKMKLGEEWRDDPQLQNMVMTHTDGGVFWDTDVRTDMKRIISELQQDMEFEAITPHTLRHTFATRCVENGMPLQVLKTILGHSSLAMTADLYSHVLPDTKAEEMKKIANLF